MNLREITVGRSKNCDIYLDPRCKYASNTHGTFYYDGNRLMYRDTSTNGTMVNNVNVHHRAVPVNHGDIIMVAGRYPLNWNQIDSYIAPPPRVETGTVAQFVDEACLAAPKPDFSKWNWGAFFLSGIWGLGNGCWWLFLIYIFIIILSFIPLVNVMAGLMSLALSITCGVKGTEWAWTNKSWGSVQDFEHTQSTWAKVGVGFFILGLVTTVMGTIFIIGQFL